MNDGLADSRQFSTTLFRACCTSKLDRSRTNSSIRHSLPGRLEACLETPQQTFDNQLLYPTVEDQAAILFYLLNKNHPFANGNKRIALTALLVFLFLNGKWLVASQDDLFAFAMGVAASDARSKDVVVQNIRIFLSEHVVATEGVGGNR